MKDTMCGLVKEVNAPSGLVYHTDLPIPEINDDEVLIKVHCSAICGTDLHIMEWDEWSQKRIKPPLPWAMRQPARSWRWEKTSRSARWATGCPASPIFLRRVLFLQERDATHLQEREAVRLHPERSLRRIRQDPLGLHVPAGG